MDDDIWSVICVVSDKQTIYQLVQGESFEAVFVGTYRKCNNYIRRMSK